MVKIRRFAAMTRTPTEAAAIVADRLDRGAHAAPQKDEHQHQEQRHRRQGGPVGDRLPHRGVVGVQRDQGFSRFALDQRVEIHQKMSDGRDHPGGDGEFAAAQPQHKGRQRQRGAAGQ
jgi:hypothetical protein